MKIQNLFDPQMSSRNQNKLLLFPHSLLLKPETSHKVSSAVEEPSLISNPSPRPRWTNTARLCPGATFDMRQWSLGSSAAWLSSERRDLKSPQLPTRPSFTPTPTFTCLHTGRPVSQPLPYPRERLHFNKDTEKKGSNNQNLKAGSSMEGFPSA